MTDINTCGHCAHPYVGDSERGRCGAALPEGATCECDHAGNSGTPICVWRFEYAPDWIKELSPHGGNEDWVAILPSGYRSNWAPWMGDGTPFGVCSVSEIALPDGRVVRIGAHA